MFSAKTAKDLQPLKRLLVPALIIAAALAAYGGWHWAGSAKEYDLAALERQAEKYLHAEDARIEKTARRGNYLAALCADGNGRRHICVYDRDALWHDRWRANGGASMSPGKLASWNYGSPAGEAVLIFGGAELGEEIHGYSFLNHGVTYICPVDGDAVLDVFIIPDGRDDINGYPVPLGADGQKLQE